VINFRWWTVLFLCNFYFTKNLKNKEIFAGNFKFMSNHTIICQNINIRRKVSMQSNLFRKSSLESIHSPEELNEYIRITSPSVWVVMIGCLILIVAVLVWAFYGSIPNTVKARGIVFPENGVTEIIPVMGGRISDMRVKVGDYVEAGQILAVIPQEEIIKQIKEFKAGDITDEQQYSRLIHEYERQSIIVSPISGIVLYTKNTNETVSSSEAVVKIVKQEKYSDNKQIVSYIPSGVAKKLKEGMEVQVSPDFAPREEYGYMYGHITSIGMYPVSQEDVLRVLGDMQYVEGLDLEPNCVEVRITLTVDPNSKSKIKWSNKKGKSLPISIGTYTNMLVLVRKYNLYELIFN